MDPKELENLIEALFESTHFKLLLAEEFRNVTPTLFRVLLSSSPSSTRRRQ